MATDWRAPRFGSTAQAPSWTVSGPMDTGPTGGSLAGMMGGTAAAPADTGPSQADLDKANNAEAMKRQKDQQEYESGVRQRAAIDAVESAFSMYGLSSLFGKVREYAQQGLNADAIVLALRQTPEYKARFPAMEALNKKGRAISEGDYVQYERTAAQAEQRYGLPKGMLMGQVTKLLTEEVSAAEMNERVVLAVSDSLSAPDDLRNTLRDYYNIDPDTALAAYYLDPEVAVPLLEKQSAAARVGVWATRSGLSGVGRGMAESLQGLGVSEDQAQQGFGQVAYTAGLGAGKGDSASQETRIKGTLGSDANAAAAQQRAADARKNRFAGGSGYAAGKSGVSGLGSSAS